MVKPEDYNELVRFWNAKVREGKPFTPAEMNKHLDELKDSNMKIKSWQRGFVKQLELFNEPSR